MSMDSEADPQFISPPKLALFSLPDHTPDPPTTLTPPLQTPASVPFQWEEAPGQPRNPPEKPKAARCLELPPRMLKEAKITKTPSPDSVLDGPESGQAVSQTTSFSFRKVSFRSSEGGLMWKLLGKERVNFSSWRWEGERGFDEDAEGDFDFSSPFEGPEEKAPRRRKRSGFWANIYKSVKQAVPNAWRRVNKKN